MHYSKNVWFLVISLIILSSCGKFKISNVEQAAVDSVITQYGCTSSKWKKYSGFKNTDRDNRFQLELTNSPTVKNFESAKKELTSGIALNLYSWLGESQEKYDWIEIKLVENDQFFQAEYKTENLKKVAELLPIFYEAIEQIEDNKAKELFTKMELSDTSIQEEDIMYYCDMSDSLIGNYQDNVLFSFGKYKEENSDFEYTLIRSLITGSTSAAVFEMVFNPNNNKIAGFHFNTLKKKGEE